MKKMKCNRVDCFRYIVDESGDYCKALADKRGYGRLPILSIRRELCEKDHCFGYGRLSESDGTRRNKDGNGRCDQRLAQKSRRVFTY